ncbi:adenylosuccinate synthase [Streptacidiphilus sp. MAP12-16]|uniref:adenylosuccinate synthetase n=1 Tax=Streptacidiphilus sp. MAP12-16 TaxID=3156300 RepID=UPI003516DF94
MTTSYPQHTVVVDLGYGDAGKGTVVDRLCQDTDVRTVVRFNGGAQAAHNVVTPDGRHHTFAQFGSGTLRARAGADTHLSRFMLVDPVALAAEAAALTRLGVHRPLTLLSVDRRALLTTPYHAAANRHRETARGGARHGSCGLGIGETAAYALAHPDDALAAGDCAAPARLLAKLSRLRDRLTADLGLPDPLGPPVEDCAAPFLAFADHVTLTDESFLPRLLRSGPVVFEGAQGVLLDEWHGFHPYTTWSTTTFGNAETLLAEAGAAGTALRLGVLRSYTTRHGPGPMVTEDQNLRAALPEPHNGHGPWQGAFRLGHFDAVAHRYALAACGGADALALTHLDAPARHPGLAICESYRVDGDELHDLPTGPPGDLERQSRLTALLLRARPGRSRTPGPAPAVWTEAVADTLRTPVLLESHGPRATDKHWWATAALDHGGAGVTSVHMADSCPGACP